MLVSYLPFRLAQKHYFSAATQLQYGAFTRHADTPCIDSDCNCCRFIANNSLRDPPRPPRPPFFCPSSFVDIAFPLPLFLYHHRISRVLPFSCIVHGNSESCQLEPRQSECASNEIGIHERMELIPVCVASLEIAPQ